MSEPSEKQSDLQENQTDQDSSQESDEIRQKPSQAERLLKCLAFDNPGPKMTDFDLVPTQPVETAEMSTGNEKYKATRKYDESGKLICNGEDLCDCLDQDCVGCFNPCPKCNSTKCGIVCRCNREWVYESIIDESGSIIRTMPFTVPD